jgi:hypothetical protein
MDASTVALIIIGAVGAVAAMISAITPLIRNWRKKRQAEAAKVRPRLEADEAIRKLSPQYEVAIKAPSGQTGDQAPDLLHLLVTFTGPAALGHLDRLTVALTPDRLPARLRACYRFRPGTRPRTDDRGADAEGRISRCERVEGGEKLLFLLERTAPADWRGSLAVSLDAYRVANDLDLPSYEPGTWHWSHALVLSVAAARSLGVHRVTQSPGRASGLAPAVRPARPVERSWINPTTIRPVQRAVS